MLRPLRYAQARPMTVYVDDMRAKYGRMVMCHMIADTEDELQAMADKIGVARKCFQGDHYDICVAMRTLAVANGAVELPGCSLAGWQSLGDGRTPCAGGRAP